MCLCIVLKHLDSINKRLRSKQHFLLAPLTHAQPTLSHIRLLLLLHSSCVAVYKARLLAAGAGKALLLSAPTMLLVFGFFFAAAAVANAAVAACFFFFFLFYLYSVRSYFGLWRKVEWRYL